MTRERAIQLAKKWSKGLACSLREGEAEEYHEMFLEMLCDESRPRKLMRHGEWRLFDEAPFGVPYPIQLWACSICGHTIRVDGSRPEEDFCSECGAKMTIKE